MMRKIPPLNAIKAFESAGRHNSFTKAADELCVSQGAISKQIAVLEEWLNTQLFLRTQSQLKLTEAGQELLATVTPAFDRIALTTMRLTERSTEAGILNVNAPPTFTMRWLIPRISSFQRLHPEIEIKLTTSTAPINFREFSYDIAIRGFQVEPEIDNATAFMSETILPICHPNLLKGKLIESPNDINKFPLITYDTAPMKWSDWATSAGVSGYGPAVTPLQFEQMYFALQAANEGLGIVLAPLFLAADDISTGKLCAPFGVAGARQRKYYAVSRIKTNDKPIFKVFHQWLKEESIKTEIKMEQLLEQKANP
ncbi:LysR substrate-binding domain-containing protein [Polynucleobacter sp. AP-Nickl1-40-C4]|uniref:LysR substrate-binding domain-containing protein n=1 Tax=Polynucleobacter sp. AP-Nickl1-40-C4 TaxID=3108275 RepID=UPI002B23E008|nr:LysR substrate-binding domain-containing protein [Polynucleobacter sp. AP-Nickl1-40-C4]MEA9568969.1 LysR substrate-binding domain-containing protein [Polynucleobacter sp. AP-Nickl1-40-C4]